MGFISGAFLGLVAGIIFGVPIWNWVKSKGKQVGETIDKNQNTTTP